VPKLAGNDVQFDALLAKPRGEGFGDSGDSAERKDADDGVNAIQETPAFRDGCSGVDSVKRDTAEE